MQHLINSFSGLASHASFIGEARLCRFSTLTPTESINSGNEMRRNPALNATRELYDNDEIRGEYAELRQPMDRIWFRSLHMAEMTSGPLGAAVANHNRSVFSPFDTMNSALNLPATVEPPPPSLILAEAGRRLRGMLKPAQLTQLLPGHETATDEQLGMQFFDARNIWTRNWTQGQNVNDRAAQLLDKRSFTLIRAPIELYRSCRTTLDALLRTAQIQIPGTQSPDSPGVRRLTPREYAGLLALVWKSRSGEIGTALTGAGTIAQKTEALRTLIRDLGSVRVMEAYDRMALDELGATEMLRSMQIPLGSQITNAYLERRRGIQPRIAPPGPPAPGTLRSPPIVSRIPEQEVFRTIDSAATWIDNPGLAIPFLRQHLPQGTAESRDFLKSLRFHFGSPAERAAAGGAALSIENTRATLVLIANSLTSHETVVNQSRAQTETFRKNLNVTQTINEFAGNMKDIVADWQNNPVLAAAVVAGGLVALRFAYKFVKGDHPRWVNWGVYAGLGGLAYGLYQERQQGHAWWNGLSTNVSDWMRGQNALPPERQTLPNFWAREMQMDTVDTRKCFSVLQDQKISTVCGFYADMERWESNGSRGPQPSIPPTFEMGRYRDMFGQRDPKAIGVLLYKTLQGFFANRGGALSEQGFRYEGQNPNATARGFAYIRDRYEGGRFFSRIVEGAIRFEGSDFDGRLITAWESKDSQMRLRELHTENPRAHQFVVALRAAYVEEQRTANQPRSSSQWMNVMLFEAPPGSLERMGRDGVQPASFLRTIQRYVTDRMHEYSPAEPGPPERSPAGVTLLRPRSAENTLLTDSTHRGIGGGRFGSVDNPPVIAPLPIGVPNFSIIQVELGRKQFGETLQKEWVEFLDRVPSLTPQSKKTLTNYMVNRISTWAPRPLTELILDIEAFKYRILAASASNVSRLNERVTSALPTSVPSVGATNAPDWLRFFIPYESERFPEINSLADVKSLLGINVRPTSDIPGQALWSRMFPGLSGSTFAPLANEIDRISSELAAFAQLPELALPGSGANGAEAVKNLDSLIARRLANRLTELSIYALQNTPMPNILDAPTNRIVSGNELASLKTYLTTMSNSLIAPNARERLQEFNKKADEVERAMPGLKVVVSGGRVHMALNTGAALPSRFIADYAALNENQRLFALDPPLSVEAFLKQPTLDTVREWQRRAIGFKQIQVQNAILPTDNPIATFNFQLTAAPNMVRYSPDGPGASLVYPIGETPVSVILLARPREIIERFNKQRVNRQAGTPFDPFG